MATGPDPGPGPVSSSLPRTLEPHGVSELARRASALSGPCRLCPRACAADRDQGERGRCGAGRLPIVNAAFPHFGEEACLVGRGGSGTVFFAGCNLGCVFCQNAGLRAPSGGRPVTDEALADLFLALQRQGCVNINLVTPTPHAVAILRALDRAARGGLCLPVVWNTASYLSHRLLEALDGVVDVYLADFKIADADLAARWLHAPDYPETALHAIVEMARQVGPLSLDGQGVARRGLLVRLLVLPGAEEDAMRVLDQLSRRLPGTAINVMGQYRPLAEARRFPPLDRRPAPESIARVRARARDLGLHPIRTS